MFARMTAWRSVSVSSAGQDGVIGSSVGISSNQTVNVWTTQASVLGPICGRTSSPPTSVDKRVGYVHGLVYGQAPIRLITESVGEIREAQH